MRYDGSAGRKVEKVGVGRQESARDCPGIILLSLWKSVSQDVVMFARPVAAARALLRMRQPACRACAWPRTKRSDLPGDFSQPRPMPLHARGRDDYSPPSAAHRKSFHVQRDRFHLMGNTRPALIISQTTIHESAASPVFRFQHAAKHPSNPSRACRFSRQQIDCIRLATLLAYMQSRLTISHRVCYNFEMSGLAFGSVTCLSIAETRS